MIDQHFLSVTDLPELSITRGDPFGPLQGGERVLWRGHAGVAEYAFERPASLPKWTLPETTELMLTDQRVRYAHQVSDAEVISGELRWLWPQHLRVQPGDRESGRTAATTTQIQLVCGGADGSWPALVFAGGDLRTAADADRVATLLRQAVARFRMDNAGKLGLTVAQSRLLSRLLIGPEFSNYQGGPGQTVSIPGALLVTRSIHETLDPPAPAYQPAANQPRPEPEETYEPIILPIVAVPMSPVAAALAAPTPAPVSPAPTIELPFAGSPPPDDYRTRRIALPQQPAHRLVGEGATRLISVRPGIAADMARALQAAKAEAATQESEPDLASRAADLAARVAQLVTSADEAPPTVHVDLTDPEGFDAAGFDAAGFDAAGFDAARFEDATTNLADRAETVRRAAARFATNSSRTKSAMHRDPGTATRGNRKA